MFGWRGNSGVRIPRRCRPAVTVSDVGVTDHTSPAVPSCRPCRRSDDRFGKSGRIGASDGLGFFIDFLETAALRFDTKYGGQRKAEDGETGMDHESAFGSEGRGRPNPDEARQDRAQAARQRCKSVTTRTQPRREQLRNVRRPQRPGAEGLEKLEGGEQKDSDD